MNRTEAEKLSKRICATLGKGGNWPILVADIIERAGGRESAISDYGIPYTVECPECSAEPGSACLMFHGNTGQMRQWPHTLRGELAVRKRACGQDAMDANEAASRAINRLGIKCGSNSAGLSNEKTGGCGQVISGIEHIFRCADCQTPFCSQRCIKKHFPEGRSCGETAWVSVADAEAVCDASEVRIRLRDGSELNGAILQSDGDWWWNNRFFDEREVTHWLPSPPTGRTEENNGKY